MKRIGILIAITCILVLGTALLLPKTDIGFAKSANIICVTDNQNIHEPLLAEDLKTITKLFEKKILYRDNPSCGFSEKIAIEINNDNIFCIARDGCPIIYWLNKDMFFRLTAEDYEVLTCLLEKYGLIIPCL